MTTPVLVVALPPAGEPCVFWTSAEYIVAAVAPLGQQPALADIWPAYAALQGDARRFASHAEAVAWAETYDGRDWLRVRAEIAKLPADPPTL
jgi:hypothetical protein